MDLDVAPCDVIYWYSQTGRPVHKLRFPLSPVPGEFRRLKSFGGSLSKPTTNIIIETNNGHLYRNHNNSLRTKTQNPDGIDSKALFQQFQGVSRVLSDETLLSKNFLRNKLNHTNSNALTNKTVFPFDTNINRVTQQTLSGRVNKL